MSAPSPEPEGRVLVHESEDENKTYKYSFTYEKASLYEFKYERAAEPDPIDPCFRCNKQAFPDDQINVGVLFHKQCFRCRICGVPLTTQSFYRNNKNGSKDKECFCKTHVGKSISELKKGKMMNLDAINNPQKKYVIQIDGTSRPGLTSGRSSPRSGSPRRSPRHSPNTSMNHGHSPGSSMTSVTPRSMHDQSSMGSPWTTYTPHSADHSFGNSYDMKSFSHPKPVLQSYEDFENSNVFEAQSFLEARHKEEEERLQRFLLEEREKEMKRLDDSIAGEKERAAEELLANIDQVRAHGSTRSLLGERDRIEDHFKTVRDDRFKTMQDKMGTEEKNRTTKMLERHCHEMLTLIGEKDREADRSVLYDHSMRPPLEPPETKKAHLYKTPARFEQLDRKAVQLVSREYSTYTDLVRDLTRDCKSELEKVRVLFRWVIAKDLNKNTVNDIIRPSASAITLLKGVKSGKETYHQLFKRLCTYAGLHCEIILGYSKGAGYKPGMRIEGTTFRNSWTAVCIDGSWRFVNCTWAARHVSGHMDDLPQLFHKYDEFYFLTDPEDYIYQHYPDDPAWQLLEIPLPFSEFINLPVVKSPFFNYGLKFYSNYGATLSTETGMIEVRLVMPKILGFGSMLEPVNKSSGDSRSLDGRTLLRFVKNEAIFTVALPRPGLYYFSIFTGDFWHSECLESACSFLISCSEMSGPPSPPYPPVPFFGATPIMEKLGISTESTDPLIVCNSDYLEINFKMENDTKVSHTFQYFDVADESVQDIDRYVFLRSRNDTGATYLVRCPKEGFYIFSLFCADPTGDKTSLDCAYRYLVICQEPSPSGNAFPKTFPKWQRCTLYEPVGGDLMTDKRYTFRLDVPQAVEVFLVIGDIWHHLKRKLGFTWETNVNTGNSTGSATIYARFPAGKDQSLFSQLLEYELVDEIETEI
ncbi:hillarin-like [Haliotis cracherodii]|uniref:hillarin-like n=1 Tax=Haliotis cracherodii TaxID=6455 RepID=UPI0039ED7A6A